MKKEDDRVRTIYESYHSGRTIFMDDLQYLCEKDPDGCHLIMDHIVHPINELQESKERLQNKVNEYGKEQAEYSLRQSEGYPERMTDGLQNYLDYNDRVESLMGTMQDIETAINGVQRGMGGMNRNEKSEVLKHLNESSELGKLYNKLKYWEDDFSEMLQKYTYADEGSFNHLA